MPDSRPVVFNQWCGRWSISVIGRVLLANFLEWPNNLSSVIPGKLSAFDFYKFEMWYGKAIESAHFRASVGCVVPILDWDSRIADGSD